MEQNERVISWVKGSYVLLDRRRRTYRRLRVGQAFEVWTGDCWQRVTLWSGGYRGRYMETADGHRSRLGLWTRGLLGA
jgi:hypothetical protein